MIPIENAFNRDHFGIGGNDESDYDKRTLFSVYLQSFDVYFNIYPPKDAFFSFFEVKSVLTSF